MKKDVKLLAAPANYDPAKELKVAQKIIEGGSTVRSGSAVVDAVEVVEEAVEYQGPDTAFLPGDTINGKRFDPVQHITHPNGQPKLGSKKQLLLKTEFKKSARQKLVDGVKDLFSGGEKKEEVEELPVVEEIQEEPLLFDDIPLSDDEREEIQAEEEVPATPTDRELRKAQKEAERSANVIVMGAGFVVGGEISRQKKSEEFTDLVDACAEWHRNTGHSIDLPPNIAFVFAAVGSVMAMAKNEPACAQRVDKATRAVRENALVTLGEKMPFLKVFLGSDTSAAEEITDAEIIEKEAE